MSIKTIAIVAAVILLVGAGWFFRDAPAMRETADSVAGFGKSILPDNKYTVVHAENEKNAGRSEKGSGAGALRKCIQDARTIYTDEKCPPGSREAPTTATALGPSATSATTGPDVMNCSSNG